MGILFLLSLVVMLVGFYQLFQGNQGWLHPTVWSAGIFLVFVNGGIPS